MTTKKYVQGGLFIVIGGTDGTGKKTQTDLAKEWFEEKGYTVKTIAFPRYEHWSSRFVTEYLGRKRGKGRGAGVKEPRYGSANELDPKIASQFYALDRFDAGFTIRPWLNKGYVVISDRYTESNAGHQGGKIADPKKRKKFIDWLFNLEYGFYKIPKPAINIILWLPSEMLEERISKRGIAGDAHEKDPKHLLNASESYHWLAKNYPNFVLIECADKKGKILNIEEVAEKVDQILEKTLAKKAGKR